MTGELPHAVTRAQGSPEYLKAVRKHDADRDLNHFRPATTKGFGLGRSPD